MEPLGPYLSVELEEVKPLRISIRQLPSPYEIQDDYNLSSSAFHNVQSSSVNVAQQPSPSKGLKIRTTMSSTSSKQKVLRPLPAVPSSSIQSSTFPRPPRPPRPLPSPPCTSSLSTTPPKISDAEDDNSLTSVSEIKLDSLPRKLPPRKLPPGSDSFVALLPEIREERHPSPIPKLPKLHEDQYHLDPPLHHLPKLCPNRLRLQVDELILDESNGCSSLSRTQVLASDDRPHEPAYVTAAISMENLLDMVIGDDVEKIEGKGGGNMVRIECSQASKDANFRFNTRFSRHWLREKRGRRWEEENYQSILNSLRSL